MVPLQCDQRRASMCCFRQLGVFHLGAGCDDRISNCHNHGDGMEDEQVYGLHYVFSLYSFPRSVFHCEPSRRQPYFQTAVLAWLRTTNFSPLLIHERYPTASIWVTPSKVECC